MNQEYQYNPITALDYPDPDVIRVGDTYYMVSTTMHFMPGCEILRSYNLVDWEHAAYVYETLDVTPKMTLENGQNAYGQGMWAATLRYHKGMFYICFVANDTRKTYLFMAEDICGPWVKKEIKGFYHDCSLLFDENDKVYIAYGNKDIYITQLKEDLSEPLEGGLHRLVVSDTGNNRLGYEGTHFYKINGRYYLFFIHSLKEEWKRVEACFSSDSLDGEFVGGDVLNDDMGYCNQGVAQGGIVDTPEGNWYAVLFQDRGAVGRIPILLPVTWEGAQPVFGREGKVPKSFSIPEGKPDYEYEKLTGSDDFKQDFTGSITEQIRHYGCFGLKSFWQFNHIPDMSLVSVDGEKGILSIRTDTLSSSVTQTKNILTQRMQFPKCSGAVTVNAADIKEGDYAGLCALQGCFGMVAVTKRDGKYFVVMQSKVAEDASLQASGKENMAGQEWEAVAVSDTTIRLKIQVDFAEQRDEAAFFCFTEGEWRKIGITHKLYFKMDHFTGCRFGLLMQATKETGGVAAFSDFVYETLPIGGIADEYQ